MIPYPPQAPTVVADGKLLNSAVGNGCGVVAATNPPSTGNGASDDVEKRAEVMENGGGLERQTPGVSSSERRSWAISVDRGQECFRRPQDHQALLDHPTHHCEIIETGNESWRFKNRS